MHKGVIAPRNNHDFGFGYLLVFELARMRTMLLVSRMDCQLQLLLPERLQVEVAD